MIPVTVLTGFLGSGKTTLLARLLRSPEFSRTAVIINEFGAVGIDHDLVEASEESFVELETGCLCCTIRGDLEATIADLVARRARGIVPAFERIVIETSGLADPAPILNAVMTEAGRGGEIALAGVVTTVDAMTGPATLAHEPQSLRQVAVADCLLMTKIDLAGAAPEALLARLAAINPRAPVLTAMHGVVEPKRLFDRALAGEASGAAEIERWLAADQIEQAHASGHVHHAAGHGHSRHGDELVCRVIRRQRPVRAVVLALFLETLADHLGRDLLRLKGIVHVAENPAQPAVIHGVQHVFHTPAWQDRWPSADHSTRLVLIGRNISEAWVNRLLDALEAEADEITPRARKA